MTRKKQVSIHEIRRKELSRLRLSPVKKKKRYTKSEQAKIRRYYNKYKDLINSPDDYKKVNVSKKSLADELKKMGIPIAGKRAFIPKQGYDDVRITTNPHYHIPVIERRTADKIVHEPIQTKLNMLEFLEQYDKDKNKLPKGTAITIQIGENNPFKTAFTSYSSLLNYLKHGFAPKDEGEDLDELLESMEIVYIV